MQIWPFISAGMLLACLVSFSWAMRNFFTRPAGDNLGMKIIALSGSGFALLHLAAIAATPHVTARQALGGVSIYLCALALFWWTIRANSRRPLSAAFSPDTPLHLVQHGPYRLVRHPFYCCYLLTWTAGVVSTGRVWLLPSVAMMLAIYFRAANVEEDKFARSPLAPMYARYRAGTGMFLPNPVKLWVKLMKGARLKPAMSSTPILNCREDGGEAARP